jgi:hypothetical protein
MANVNATVEEVYPQAGSDMAGFKLGFLNSATKAAQNDTVTVTNASVVEWVKLTLDADGVAEPATLSTNVITLTADTTGAVSGLVRYK